MTYMTVVYLKGKVSAWLAFKIKLTDIGLQTRPKLAVGASYGVQRQPGDDKVTTLFCSRVIYIDVRVRKSQEQREMAVAYLKAQASAWLQFMLKLTSTHKMPPALFLLWNSCTLV